MDNEKLIAAKEQWARQGRGLTGSPSARATRLPPGQHTTQGLPVLDLGKQPLIDTRDWRFTVAGAIERPLEWTWAAFQNAPQVEIKADIHCVTTWSSYDNVFTGVPVSYLLEQVKPKPSARFVMARSFDGYSTNLPLADLQADSVLLAHTWNGQPFDREHGGPVRLLVPHLYFWKSAKWVRHLTFMEQDQPGFWEARGYHRRGDPWSEERYGSR